jgi:hypothetical protein
MILSKTLNFLVLCAAISTYWPVGLSVICGAEADISDRSMTNHVTAWQTIYGPIHFEESGLFVAMTYLQPQPDHKFTRFTTEILAKTLLSDSKRWMDIFFKGDLRMELAGSKPSAYYVNQGRNEPSLIRYESKLPEGRHVVVVENFSAVCITVAFNNEERDGIMGSNVARFVFQNTRLPYGSVKEIEDAFSLPERMPVGETFANSKKTDVATIRDWNDMVFGFVGKGGVSFLILKAVGERASFGLLTDFNWINNRLYKADGVTLIDAPRTQGRP